MINQIELLIETAALKLPRLYQSLVNLYGETEGKRIYQDIFEDGFKKRYEQFKGQEIGAIMKAEENFFPLMGWEIEIEKVEAPEGAYYLEHLKKCPHLEATKKYGLELPCEIICGMDVYFAEKYQLAVWQRLKHLPSGDSECCFKIRSNSVTQ